MSYGFWNSSGYVDSLFTGLGKVIVGIFLIGAMLGSLVTWLVMR